MSAASRSMKRSTCGPAMIGLRCLMIFAAALLASVVAAEPPAAATPAAKASPVLQLRRVLKTPSGDTEEMTLIDRSNNPNDWRTLYVEKKVLIDETSVKSAGLQEDGGERRIMLTLTDEGAKKFADVTSENINKLLAIVINGTLYAAPNIRMTITGGQFAISGAFSKEEAVELASKIAASVRK